MSTKKEHIAAARAAVKKFTLANGQPYGYRYDYLVYAFVRGRAHETLERRVSENNLPRADIFATNYKAITGEEPDLEAVRAWLTVPEERRKRWAPRVPRIRRSNRRAAE